MSKKYNESKSLPIDVLVNRLKELSDAGVDRDADIVLNEAADRLNQFKQEREELVYKDNNVQHWEHKAKAYSKECAGAIYDLKKLLGVDTPTEVLERVKRVLLHLNEVKQCPHCDGSGASQDRYGQVE